MKLFFLNFYIVLLQSDVSLAFILKGKYLKRFSINNFYLEGEFMGKSLKNESWVDINSQPPPT